MTPADTPLDSTYPAACVYALCEPEEPHAVRYIGVTRDLHKRLLDHGWDKLPTPKWNGSNHSTASRPAFRSLKCSRATTDARLRRLSRDG